MTHDEKTDLEDLKTEEISFVPEGANQKQFLLLKAHEGEHMDELKTEELIELLEKGLTEEVEKQLTELIEKQKLSPKTQTAIRGAMRLLSSVRDELPDKALMGKLAAMLGGASKGGHQDDEEKNMNKLKKEQEEKEAEAARLAKEAKEAEEAKAAKLAKEKDTGENTDIYKERFEAIEKQRKADQEEIVDLKKSLKVEKDDRVLKEFIVKAAEFKNTGKTAAELGQVLKTLSETSEAAYTEYVNVLKSMDAQIEQSKLFGQLGSDLDNGNTSGPGAKLEQLTKEYVAKSSDKMSFEQAYAEVCKTPEGKKLYAEHEAQGGR